MADHILVVEDECRCWAVNRTGGVSFTVLLPGLQSER